MDTYQIGATLTDRHRMVLDAPEAYLRHLQHLTPGRYTVTIGKEESKRSLAANRYLWGPVYGVIAEYTGQDKEDIHDEMCARFTAETVSYVNPNTGDLVEMQVVRRTSGMTVGRFHKFVEDVKLFGQEFFGLTFEDAPAEFYRERERAEKREKGRAA